MDDDMESKRELDEMLPEQEAVNEDDDDGDDNDDEDEDYDLIGVPGAINPKPMQANSSDEEVEQLDGQKKEQIGDDQEEPPENDEAGDVQDLTTIEVMSSELDDYSESDEEEEEEMNEGHNTATPNDTNDDNNDDDAQSDSSASEDNNMHISTTDESDNEASFEELLAEPDKKFGQLMKLSEIAFQLHDLDKIEQVLQILQNDATVPAHIWLKYLQARQVVTQTPEEHEKFLEQCVTALGYQYSIPLAAFVVDYLEDQENQNHVIWAKLLADYNLECPNFGVRLSAKFSSSSANDEEVAAFQELMQEHCPTWKVSAEERETISTAVSGFKVNLDKLGTQYDDWAWIKLHSMHIEQTLSLNLNDDIKNSIIRFIFERSVSKFPKPDRVWLAYIRFITGKVNQPEGEDNADELDAAAKRASRLGKGYLLTTPIDLAKRGIRCHPSVRLNHLFLALMEQAQLDQAAVDVEIHKVLKRLKIKMSMAVELYLDYLAYCVRHTNYSDPGQAETLRSAFSKSWEDLSATYGAAADSSYEILQLWAQVEYAHMRSPSHGSNLWRTILGYPGSRERGTLWSSFAQMEAEYNGGRRTRQILYEALRQPVLADGAMVQEHLRRFERCFGTYHTIAACQATELPSDYLVGEAPRWRSQRPYHQQAPWQAQRQFRPQAQWQAQRQQYRPQLQQQQAPRHYRPQLQHPPQRQYPLHQQQQQAPRQSLQQPQAKPQAPPQAPLNRQERRRQAHEMMLKKQKQKNIRKEAAEEPTVPQQPVTQESPAKAATEVRESHLKYSAHLETNKVFVRNLHSACTKEELQELFTHFGEVKDVRLIHKPMQKKGIAYIEFEKSEDAQQAVNKLNGHELRGLPLFVAISNPPPKTKPPGSTADGGVAKVAPKKRVITSLIPTSVVRQEAAVVAAKKRRIELVQEEDDPQPSTSSNGKPAANAGPETEESAPKSNDDFRKLFFKE